MKIRSSLRTAFAPLRPVSHVTASSLLLASIAACSGPAPIEIERPFLPNIVVTDTGWLVLPTQPHGGTVPDFGSLTPLRTSGSFSFEGESATGTATLSAVVADVTSEEPPSALGTGSFVIPVEGVEYARSDAAATAAVFPDESEMLILAAYVMDTDPSGVDVGTVVWIAVPTADAVSGAAIALDGESRIAVFGTGPLDTESPETAAVAVTGTVTFGAVDLAVGGTIEATLSADFTRAVFDDVRPVDPPTEPAPTFAEGAYTLTIEGTADVHCEGTLAGREAELAALDAASYGIAGGAVVVSGPAEALTMSGAAIESIFALPSLDASWQGEVGAFTAFTDGGGAGALGLTEEGRFLLARGPGAEPLIGLMLIDAADPSGGSYCQVGFAGLIR